MMFKQPTRYCLVAGRAEGFTRLNAFDQALLAAGVGDTNLVRMSSILPPGCDRAESLKLPYGALVPVAYARQDSSTPGERIAAAVAVAVPLDPGLPGLIMEHHGAGRREEVEAKVREMAEHGMRFRDREIKALFSIGIEHTVTAHGAVFAGVVLWDETERGPLS